MEIPQNVETNIKKKNHIFPLKSLFSLLPSVIWYGCVTVSMVDGDRPITAIVQLKHVAVSVVPPPGAQLSVPATSQRIKEFRMLHADHGEEVLVAQVAPETILVGQFGHTVRFQQLVVEGGCSHGGEVQQHHPTVEAWETIRMGLSDFGLRVLFTILPEGVSDDRKKKGKPGA